MKDSTFYFLVNFRAGINSRIDNDDVADDLFVEGNRTVVRTLLRIAQNCSA